jgi:dTDP-4-dehydrorhamnose 3,5-epimerase
MILEMIEPLPILETQVSNCFRLLLPVHVDYRGRFVKAFHAPTFSAHGLLTVYDEDFFSVSRQNVLRGFHFMTPPFNGVKLVIVIQGRIMDSILDLRQRSPTYGQHQCFELDGERGDALYLAPGIAHAFLTLSETAIVGYKSEFPHSPAHDAGVRWDSTPVQWPTEDPVISERDLALPPLKQLSNPFP